MTNRTIKGVLDCAVADGVISEEDHALSDERIREIFMAHGFTIKEGQTDLKPYVYAAARALLAEQAAAPMAGETARLTADDADMVWPDDDGDALFHRRRRNLTA